MELPKTVEACHAMIQELLDENASLRQSGASFGRLAERLNSELQEERRNGRERRLARHGEDRRGDAPPDRQGSASR
ncbi:MAG: hypothetical protein V7647_2491 [Acidobacteriota bacterium]|jgi:hypothetical protein